MIKQLLCWLFLVFFVGLSTGKAQNQRLMALADSLVEVEVARQERIKKFADSLHLELRFELEDGRIIELVDIENNIPTYYTTLNNSGGQLINADQAYPGGGLGLALTGAGQRLGIWDGGGVRTTHQEFVQGGTSRVIQRDVPGGLSGHATHVAGTMIAAGIESDQQARGMAFQAALDAYDWSADLLEMTEAATEGLQVSQHSYGNITGWAHGSFSGDRGWHWFGDLDVSTTEDYRFGLYDNRCRSWDVLANAAPEYLIFKSAGNDRGSGPVSGTQHYVRVDGNWTTSSAIRNLDGGLQGYDCIIDAGNSKNVVTIGAVTQNGAMSTFSSWGPTDDGRIKPDIVAKGVSVYSATADGNTSYAGSSGTSMSGPMVSGAMGLIHQMYDNTYPGKRMLASTAKALILHTANDLVSGAPGPDYRFGWGLMDVAKAVTVIGDNHANGEIHMQELTLEEGREITIPIVASGGQPLRVTLVWNDPAGTPGPLSVNDRTPKLVNDLDLRVKRESGTVRSPYILDPDAPQALPTTGDNFRDNVEMVHIANPASNERFTITITHKNSLQGGRQDFSIIITGNSPTAFEAKADQIRETSTLLVLGNTIFATDVTVAQLVIPADQHLRIQPGSVFTVTESWRINGELTFESDATTYAVGALTEDFSGVGNLTLQQFVSAPGTYIFGGPFGRSIAAQGAISNGGTATIADWDAANGDWRPAVIGSYFLPFKGYRVSVGAQGYTDAPDVFAISGLPVVSSAPLLEFGELVEAQQDFSSPTTRTGWNLLANPFPAALDFSSLDFSLASNVEQAFYVEEHLDTDQIRYRAYSPAGSPNDQPPFLAPMQGFWVRTTASSPVFAPVSFSNTTVQKQPKAYKRNSIPEHLELQVLKDQTQLDHLTLALVPQATDGFDNGLDARKMISKTAPAALFSLTGEDFMAINAISFGMYSFEDKIIPLGTYLDDESGNYFIALNDNFLFERYDVVLEDQFLNVFHDLRRNDYQFSYVADEAFRFRLHLSNTTAKNASDFNPLYVWYATDQIHIRSRAYLGDLSWVLYDMHGKAVVKSGGKLFFEPTQKISFSTRQLAAGTYVLRITTDTGEDQMKFTLER